MDMTGQDHHSMAVKIYFDIRDDQIGLYRSVRTNNSTTFGELHSRISEKIGISKARKDFRPPSNQLVTSTIENEETAWAGEVKLLYVDIRAPSKRLIETTSANEEVHRNANNNNLRMTGVSPMTEFFYHSEGTERFSAITAAVLVEVENVCTKKGKLSKMQKGKDAVFREVLVYLDQTRLWYSKGMEGDPSITSLELSLHDAVKIVDENTYTFTVRDVTGCITTLRAKSRAEMTQWVTTVEQRNCSVSENNLIAMADDHIAEQEYDRSEDNLRSLSALSEFRGTLCNRYLRSKFRKYLENNDEDQLLRFWEYAEDFKLCHSSTHRFDELHDRREATPGGASSLRAWPDNYKCTATESKKFAAFIYNTFLAAGAKYTLRLQHESPELRQRIEEQLSKAPRTLFVALQRVVMQDLAGMFYQDFARAQRYRDYFVSASMDLFGCHETESAVLGPLSPGAPATVAFTPATPASAISRTPATDTRPRTHSLSFPFPFARSRSNSEVTSPFANKVGLKNLRKATSLDSPGAPSRSLSVYPLVGTPATIQPAGGIAFGTPGKEPPGSPMSFVFTPSPSSSDVKPVSPAPATPKASNSPAAPVEKKRWFSNLRIFKKDEPSGAEQRYNGRKTASPAAPSTPLKGESPGTGLYCPSVAGTPGSYEEDANAPFRHPMWQHAHTHSSSFTVSEVTWLSDAWWRGKAPAMERYLSTIEAAVQVVAGGDEGALYHTYAQWAPGKNLEDILKSIRTVNVSESMLNQLEGPSPLTTPSQSFSYGLDGQNSAEYTMSPLRDSFEDSLKKQLSTGQTSPDKTGDHTRHKNVIVWKGSHGHKAHKGKLTHHRPQSFKRTSDNSDSTGSPAREQSVRDKTEFVVSADSVENIEHAGDVPVAVLSTKRSESEDAHRHDAPVQNLMIPIGMYGPRVVRDASNLSTPVTTLSKPRSCAPYSLIFATEHKMMVHGVPIPWSASSTMGMKASRDRTASDISNKGYNTPSSSFNERMSACATTPGSQGKSKGTNIFMNRKTEAYARLGELSRQNELSAGRLKGESQGMQVAAVHPLPPYLSGFRGQILMWAHVRAKYMKHAAPSGGSTSSSSSVVSGGASIASSKMSQPSVQKVGASPRHLSGSRGLADLTIGSATFPPPPENDVGYVQQQPRPLQDKEIEHSDMARYSAVLLLCPDGYCSIVLYGYGGAGGAAVTDATHDPQLRAIVNLQKATLLGPSSLHAFNIHDESGLVWSIYPEGIDDDDTRGGSKRWLDMIREHISPEVRAPRVVGIMYQGYLAKRGLVNTAFRRRWFVLNSKQQLRYYKEESGQCKGEISVAQVLSLERNDRELSLHTKNRLWVLQADNTDEAELWESAVRSMLSPLSDKSDGVAGCVEPIDETSESFMDDD